MTRQSYEPKQELDLNVKKQITQRQVASQRRLSLRLGHKESSLLAGAISLLRQAAISPLRDISPRRAHKSLRYVQERPFVIQKKTPCPCSETSVFVELEKSLPYSQTPFRHSGKPPFRYSETSLLVVLTRPFVAASRLFVTQIRRLVVTQRAISSSCS